MLNHIIVPELTTAETRILVPAFQAAMHAPNPGAAGEALLAVLGERFGARRAYVYEIQGDSNEFTCTYEWCAPGVEPMSDVTRGITMDMAARWFGDGEDRSLIAAQGIESLAATSPAYAALFAARNMDTQILGKLMRGNRPLGTLGFDDPAPEMFDEICQLMYPVCAFATSILNTRNLIGSMRRQGVVDKLTGAGTRMGFYEMAERLPHEAPIGMAYYDIVGLQAVNDVRGHDAGDELLIAVRSVLASEFQDQQVFRMGGDEFLVAVVGVGRDDFMQAVGRVRERLNDLSVYVADGVTWQPQLGAEYDSLVRRTWLACNTGKQEWERRGGKRLESQFSELDGALAGTAHPDAENLGEGLDIPCYRSDEFFRRANIWVDHVETRRVGMLAFDVNYFKLYNDIYGREAGDRLLENYGKSLAKLATQHRAVSGYLGGDNFAFAFPVRDQLSQELLAKEVEDELAKHDVAEGFAPSVGVAISDAGSVGMSVLYDRALVALGEVKGSYTRHVNFYDEGRYERERENQLLLIEAQTGVANGEFTFFLQPKVDISTNKVVSAEALVRWIHDGQIVPPYKFIELMERSGYIFALDRHIWEEVCRWQRSLLDRGINPVPVSVNVSRIDFYFTDLADHFMKLVEKYDLPPKLVGIEVTESAYSKDTSLINDVIRRMQGAGFLVFMDDFGSGYSSLNMLRSVAVDVLKMDKGFIDNANIRDGSDAIIENVINMAHMMDLPVISEGVETEEQRDSLRHMGCDYVQGYYYYKPMPKDEFEKILKNGEIIELEHADNIILAINNTK